VQRPEEIRQHYAVTLGALIGACLGFALLVTLVVPALPVLQRDLNTTPEWSTWIVTVYLLTAAVMTPLLGKLGDQFGKGRMLKVSLAIFLVGTIGAALAWDIASLIVFRAVQGAAGAIFPLSFAIIRDEFPPERVGVGMGLLAGVWGVGGSLGIVLSGPLVDGISWRAIFAVAAVGVALSLLLVHRYVPESPVRSPSPVDVSGALLLSGGLVSLLLAVTEGERWGWGSPPVVGLFLAAAAFTVVWIHVERRSESPLLDLDVFARRPMVAANLAAFTIGVTMFSSFVLMPSFIQSDEATVGYGFGASVWETGVYYFLPGSLLMLAIGPFAGWLGRRPHASKWPLSLGLALVGVGSAMLALWHAEPWQFIVGNLVFSTGVGFASASLPKLVTDSVRPTETGVANGMNMVVRNVGGVVGGQAVAAILLASAFAGSDVPGVSGYVAGFWVLAATAFVGSVVAVLATSTRRVAGYGPGLATSTSGRARTAPRA